MNILREVRKMSSRSIKRKVILVSMLTIVFIINTYAWFSISKDIELNSISGTVSNFDIAYVVSDKEVLKEDISFEVGRIYPRMPIYEQKVYVYNTGNGGAAIGVELNWVKLFGQDITELLKERNEINMTNGSTIIFASNNNDGHPFRIECTIDKPYLSTKYQYGKYTDDGYVDLKHNGKYGYETGDTGVATVKIQFIWEGTNDELDTKFGKQAFEFYQNNNTEDVKAIAASLKLNGKSA